MKLLFVGDIHGEFGKFNQTINKRHADYVFQLGDNAYYWLNNDNKGKIKPQNSKVYLIPGNHENWDTFEKQIGRRGLKPIEVETNLFYCPIGSSIKLNNLKIVFIGGAESYDKMYRKEFIDWFSQETLNQGDLNFILEKHQSADIIVSHTAPLRFAQKIVSKYNKQNRSNDPSIYALETIYDKFRPGVWVCGHWHDTHFEYENNTQFFALTHITDRLSGQKYYHEITI